MGSGMTALAKDMGNLTNALPFWLSLALVPLAVLAALQGGWTILLVPAAAMWVFSLLDRLIGKDERNADPATPEAALGSVSYTHLTLPTILRV